MPQAPTDPERLSARLANAHGVPPALIRTIVSPYRICPIGAHSDHQGGTTLGMAVSAGTRLAFAPGPTREIVLTSENFPGEARFELGRPDHGSAGGPDWRDYPRAAAWALRERLPPAPRGIVGRLAGDLPGGGLSSSASVTLAYLVALAEANGLDLDQRELVRLAVTAERDFVGVGVGILDPATIVGSRRGHLLAIHCRDERWEALPLGANAPGYRILAASTGTTRRLQSTPFNDRVKECLRAARKLAELSGRADVRGLADIPERVFEAHQHALLPGEAKRARHFFGERERVSRGVALWRAGDLVGFGRLMTESCHSSITNWESGSEELIALQDILEHTPGVIGARFSGAGFGGCCVALVEAARAGAARASVEAAMIDTLPEADSRPRLLLLDGVDGLAVT